jgi:hypothetical protein
MLKTKFCDLTFIGSVEDEEDIFFSIFRFSGPLKGSNKMNTSKFDKRLPKNDTDKVW